VPTTEYQYDLTLDVAIRVRHATNERGELVEYAVVLVVREGDDLHTVRVWDNHLGIPHMHRYTRKEGKQPEERITGAPSVQDGYDHGLDAAHRGFPAIVESWRRS
jgi:hypothetical protein